MSEIHRTDDAHARFSMHVWRPILSRALAHKVAVTGLIVGGIIVAAIETALPLLVGHLVDEAKQSGL